MELGLSRPDGAEGSIFCSMPHFSRKNKMGQFRIQVIDFQLFVVFLVAPFMPHRAPLMPINALFCLNVRSLGIDKNCASFSIFFFAQVCIDYQCFVTLKLLNSCAPAYRQAGFLLNFCSGTIMSFNDPYILKPAALYRRKLRAKNGGIFYKIPT